MLQYFLRIIKSIIPGRLVIKIKNIFNIELRLKDWSYVDSLSNINSSKEFINILYAIRQDDTASLTIREIGNIYNLVRKTKDISGDIVEVGVFKGGSAKIIALAEQQKNIKLFDTFNGVPEDSEIDLIKSGDIKGSALVDVQKYLSVYKNISFHQGIFPMTGIIIKQVSFANLDTDTYKSTLESLKFIYPTMSKNGVILCHDYNSNHLPGVKKAFDEFMCDKPEILIELWDTQAMIIKQ